MLSTDWIFFLVSARMSESTLPTFFIKIGGNGSRQSRPLPFPFNNAPVNGAPAAPAAALPLAACWCMTTTNNMGFIQKEIIHHFHWYQTFFLHSMTIQNQKKPMVIYIFYLNSTIWKEWHFYPLWSIFSHFSVISSPQHPWGLRMLKIDAYALWLLTPSTVVLSRRKKIHHKFRIRWLK